MNPICPNCAGPATRVIPEHDGSSRGVCDACHGEWWMRSSDAPNRTNTIPPPLPTLPVKTDDV